MMEPARDVLEFSRKLGAYVGDRPSIPPADVVRLRLALIHEEFDELCDAIRDRNLPGVADGAVDLIYVVLGTLIAYGVSPEPIWRAVQQANMAKASGPMREDGKRLKPPGWTPPDIAGLLRAQGWEGPPSFVAVAEIDEEVS